MTAQLAAVPVEPDDDPTDAERIEAEVAAETASDDGSIVVILETELGKAPIRVPPLGRWRSTARNALFTRGDDLAWAASVLAPADAVTWMELDPTKDESEAFFASWGRSTGQALGEANRASRRAARR